MMRLGKAQPRMDHRTLRMANYLAADLPPAPEGVDWLAKLPDSLGMMMNDQLGDCTCAAIGHIIQAWTGNNGSMLTLPDSAILQAYEAFCGYIPGRPETDQGGVEMGVLSGFRNVGVGGVKIDAFVSLQPQNREHVKLAVDMFGGAYIGLALPITAQSQDVWSLAIGQGFRAAPGSWGGHAVVVEQYDPSGLTCITWGQKKRMTWSFWDAYCDEAYAAVSPLWATAGKPAPSGFDYAQLLADLQAVSG